MLSTANHVSSYPESESPKKKPTVKRLWVFILVVVAGFEPATSAL
jgi:hypothetical protein